MKITHKLWPVSYTNDGSRQINSLYTFDPSSVDNSYWVGEPIEIEAEHVDSMPDTARIAKIAALKAELEKLEALS